jgi:peptidyl-prolyl cis-trans isomerase SurA
MIVLLSGAIVAHAETANRIAAIVNDEIITEADVRSNLNTLLENRDAVPAEADPSQLQEGILRRLIDQRLIFQEAKRLGVIVRTEEIAERVGTMQAQFPSLDEFRGALAEAKLSEEELKEKIRESLMIQHLIDQKIRSTIIVSPQEVARELGAHPELTKPGDRVRVSHLLIRAGDERSEAEAQALIERLSRQLRQGGEFAALAKRYSEEPHAEEGGDMGWVAQSELLPELDEALFRLQPGELSEPIRTKLGFHLLKIEERKSAANLTLLEANQAVYQRLYQQKFGEAFTRWLDEIRRKAYIEILTAAG